MKTTSWEIIVAGFLFVGLSIFLIENSSMRSNSGHSELPTDSLEVSSDEDEIRVFKLQSLENLGNLENLSNLENLENLKNLQNLENLKNLKNILPMEIRAEFEREIDEVIREMDQESLEVNFDAENKTVTIDPNSVTNQQGWTVKSPGVFLFTRSFDSENYSKTNLNLPFGSVDVNGNQEGTGHLFIEASGQISTLNDLRSKLAMESLTDNKTAVFELISKSKKSDDQNIQIQSRLEIPRNMELDIQTKAGHIDSDNIQGAQTYLTNGGHISLSSLSGTISAETGGGHIQIKESEGRVTLISKGGNIRVQDLKGDIELETGGGSLQIIDHEGAVNATTNGGNIELRSPTITAPVAAQTGAGTITIWISKDSNVTLDLQGSNVEIDSSLNFQGSNQSGNAMGSIGSGTYKITAKTNYGTISAKALK